MRSVKSRNWSTKEDSDLAFIMEENTKNNRKLKWKQIASLINQKNPFSNKNSKQCRQRWINHVNPQVKKLEQWNNQQNEILFSLHHKIGNKWAQIATRLPGRTDNCIKNHFYSVFRCGLRKINSYITNVKRKKVLVKTFKNQVLNKILAICEGKNQQRFQFSTNARQFAFDAKKKLIEVSLDGHQEDQYHLQLKQQLFSCISLFTKNCRKRKLKKINKKSSEQISQISESDQIINAQNQVQKIQNSEQNMLKVNQSDKNQLQNKQQKVIKTLESIQTAGSSNKITINNNYKDNLIISNKQSDFKKVPAPQTSGNLSQKIQLINSGNLANKNFGSISFPFKSNSLYNFGSGNIQSSFDWTKNNLNSMQNNRNGFLFNHVPDVSNLKTQKISNLNLHEIQLPKEVINPMIFNFDVNFPLFGSSPYPSEPLPSFTLGSQSLAFNLFGNQAQQQLLRSLRESQIQKQNPKPQNQKQ